jgi:hypothetical protein
VLLLGDHDDHIGDIDRGRGELLSLFVGDVHTEFIPDTLEGVRSCPADAGDVLEFSASEVELDNELVHSNTCTL